MNELISHNAGIVRAGIADACQKCGRKVEDITIVAITKGFPATTIRNAVENGFKHIGENRVQDAEPKITELGHIATFHMVGHLQSNKAKKAVQLFDVIQSVDSFGLAEEINRHAQAANRKIECYIQVNCSGEVQKSGVSPDDCLELVKKTSKLTHIKLTGLMTIGPLTDDEKAIRAAFAKCRELFQAGQKIIGAQFEHLSMGMSDDYHLAIAEGSTMIRLGTALFGPRPAK
jgi:pyridoxal phosphate enzyme (YggS family)